MCKNFIMTNVSKLSEKDFIKLRITCGTVLTSGADKHGFGYAAINGDTREVYGERYLDTDAWTLQHAPSWIPRPHVAESIEVAPRDLPESLRGIFVADVTPPSKEYNYFGTYGKPTGAFLAHARLSTNSISMLNTHPHCSDTYTLIHNGMVTNVGPKVNCKSTCDTEILVQHLSEGGVDYMCKNVDGYYAIGAISHINGDLIVVKDSKASLYGCYVPALESTIFATSNEQLKTILKTMKWAKHSAIRAVKNNTVQVFDVTGALIESRAITPYEKPASVSNVTEYKYDRDYWHNDAWRDVTPSRLSERVTQEEAEEFDRYYRFEDKKGRALKYRQYERLGRFEQDECTVTCRETGAKIVGGSVI